MPLPTQAQREAILAHIDAHMEEAIADLQALIRIPSVKAAAAPGAPFGPAARDCLDAALAIGRRLGLRTTALDGAVGFADAGAGAELLGILCHLDVVPAGDGWQHDPFGGAREGERIYGRGAVDDKGPAVCAFHALAAVQAAGIPLTRRVRILLGCDEESDWGCIDRYKESEEIPALSFSPDGSYPLVSAERTIYRATYAAPLPSRLRIRSGERPNVVPGAATAWVPFAVEGKPEAPGVQATYTPEAGGTRIDIAGVGAHASTPESGKSALLGLLTILAGLPIAEADGAGMIRRLKELLTAGHHGEGFGLDRSDESGRLSLSPGILRWDEAGLSLCVDLRVPLSLALEEVKAKLDGGFAGLTLEDDYVLEGHCIPAGSELVDTLLAVYRAAGGDPKKRPLAIGGGTYARAFPQAVAFGCEEPEEPMRAHMPEEYIAESEMRFHTYAIAMGIAALAGK